MNLSRACVLFGIDDIREESKLSVKKKYYNLMKKYHPDNKGGSTKASNEIGEAYICIQNKVKMIDMLREQNKGRETLICGMEDIIKAYDKRDSEFLSRAIVSDTIVIIDALVTCNGEQREISNTCAYNMYGKYVIELNINTDTEESGICIEIAGKRYESEIRTMFKEVTVKLDYDIGVKCMLTRVLLQKEE